MDTFKLDIKNDSLFKNIFLRDIGKKYMCSILSELLNLDYEDLLNNIKLYNSEHPRINIKNKSSYSDVIYEYRNKLFIIEMNSYFTKKLVHKNYFYLLFRHIFDATNENDYNRYKETYLIDIDNFDIVHKMNLNMESKFIYESLFEIKKEEISIYKNIKSYRINLDYLRKRKYNCDKLTNIERNCLIFVEKNKEYLRENIKNRYLEGVIEMLEVIEIDGKYYPLYDKEAWEASLREEAIELAKEEGMKQGISQGIEQGIYKVAKKLKNKNYSSKEIMEITGLNQDEIKLL